MDELKEDKVLAIFAISALLVGVTGSNFGFNVYADDSSENDDREEKQSEKELKEQHKEKINELKEKYKDKIREHDHPDSADLESYPSDYKGKKINVCHLPPGNSNNAHTINIPVN